MIGRQPPGAEAGRQPSGGHSGVDGWRALRHMFDTKPLELLKLFNKWRLTNRI